MRSSSPTALRYIDEHGAQALSMRALAQELGVGAISLYRYVHGREDLLEAVLALLLEGSAPAWTQSSSVVQLQQQITELKTGLGSLLGG